VKFSYVRVDDAIKPRRDLMSALRDLTGEWLGQGPYLLAGSARRVSCRALAFLLHACSAA
jgi:hypothetical protein